MFHLPLGIRSMYTNTRVNVDFKNNILSPRMYRAFQSTVFILKNKTQRTQHFSRPNPKQRKSLSRIQSRIYAYIPSTKAKSPKTPPALTANSSSVAAPSKKKKKKKKSIYSIIPTHAAIHATIHASGTIGEWRTSSNGWGSISKSFIIL